MKQEQLLIHGNYVNICIVHRWMEKKVKSRYKLSPTGIEIILIVAKLTSGGLGYCTGRDVKHYLCGYSLRIYSNVVKELVLNGYLLNHGKRSRGRRSYLELSMLGHEVVDYIKTSMFHKIRLLNDDLKLKQINKVEKEALKKGSLVSTQRKG